MQLHYEDLGTEESSSHMIFFLWIIDIIAVNQIENLSKHYDLEVRVWETFLIKGEMAFGIPVCETKEQISLYTWLILHICI